MRIGAYVDALNLSYGARRLCGRGTPGWRWLDVRGLINASIPQMWRKQGGHLTNVDYFTARVMDDRDPTSPMDQESYLRAVEATRSVDQVVYGKFVSRPKIVPLTPLDGDSSSGSRIVLRNWPLKLLDAENHKRINEVDALGFVRKREEKATDVNLATHLLLDAFHGEIDAAIIVSNDGDLGLPITRVRELMPVGVLNPGGPRVPTELRPSEARGDDGHWWGTLTNARYGPHQLPDPAFGIERPTGW